MKQFILVCQCMLVSILASAQTKIAIKGGYNHNTAMVKVDNVKQPTGFMPGINLGMQVKTSFEPPLHFTGLLSYNLRGFSITPVNGTIQKIETRIHYINLAPLLTYDIATDKLNHISLSTGPMAGIAFSGTQKITETGVTSSSKIKFSTSENYGFFDLGIHNSIAYHFKNIFIEASYYWGFVSINNNEETDKTNIKNRGFGLSLGYYIK